MDIDNICMKYFLTQFRNFLLANIAVMMTGNIFSFHIDNICNVVICADNNSVLIYLNKVVLLQYLSIYS